MKGQFARLLSHLPRNGVALLLWLTACLLVPVTAQAEAEKPAGLMWNRTGLPAVFPLQIKTTPGADYLVILSDADSGKDALAAYARGGAFFRVLVPPGQYEMRVHYGTDWQGEERLFGTGPETGTITLPDTLQFSVRGYGTKSGHLVDLRGVVRDGEDSAQINPLDLCQGVQTVFLEPREDVVPPRPETRDVRTFLPAERRALGPVGFPESFSTYRGPTRPIDRVLAQQRYDSLSRARQRQGELPLPLYELNVRTRPCW